MWQLSDRRLREVGLARAVVRLPWNDLITVKRTLDTGAQALNVPRYPNRRGGTLEWQRITKGRAMPRCKGAAS